jgi:hypothetical protein
MKRTLTLPQKNTFKYFSFISVMLLALVVFNPMYGQTKTTKATETTTNERNIKGLIANEDGPLVGVNVTQKRTKNGTVTDEKGEFTFPVKLKTGDILVISYLGYENQNITIKENTTFIDLVLTEDLVEMIGALDSAKPYKSKRKN